jgi:protein gp37
MARRLQAMGQPNYRRGFTPTVHEHMLDLPLTWRAPRTIFVNSMSDLFHPDVPLAFVQRVFETMERATWHTFQVLTKRSARLRELAPDLPWPPNVWMGVSVENGDYLRRMADLQTVPACVRFVSFEPLLARLPRLDLTGIAWTIVGGESGPGARPIQPEWVLEIRDQCLAASVPFFFKQWGGARKRRNGRLLEGRVWDEMPDAVAYSEAAS